MASNKLLNSPSHLPYIQGLHSDSSIWSSQPKLLLLLLLVIPVLIFGITHLVQTVSQISPANSGILGCVPFGESKNGLLILDLPDFAVERNVKSEIGFVTLVTFRQCVQYARQPLKK